MEKMLRKTIEINGDTLIIPELKKFMGRKVTITLEEPPEEEKKGKYLKDFFGSLKLKDDAMQFQKKMRKEWDEREKSF